MRVCDINFFNRPNWQLGRCYSEQLSRYQMVSFRENQILHKNCPGFFEPIYMSRSEFAYFYADIINVAGYSILDYYQPKGSWGDTWISIRGYYIHEQLTYCESGRILTTQYFMEVLVPLEIYEFVPFSGEFSFPLEPGEFTPLEVGADF